MVFGGWKGELDVVDDVLRIRGSQPDHTLDVDCAQVKRCSFNSNNGLWVLKMKDGTKHYIQSSGVLLSADRSPAGREANEAITDALSRHDVPGFAV